MGMLCSSLAPVRQSLARLWVWLLTLELQMRLLLRAPRATPPPVLCLVMPRLWAAMLLESWAQVLAMRWWREHLRALRRL